MSTPRRLLVTGATGKQGGALISALVSNQSQPFEIYAVTRNKNSKSAQALANQPNVQVIQGDFDNPDEIFQQIDQPWGLFAMTTPMNAKTEERQGKAMTAAALKARVQHIVFTATDRGGDSKSDETPTCVSHFKSKFNIEQDIMERTRKQGATWTFLRPVAFMENMSNDFIGRGFVAMWRLNGLERPLQFISSRDIGKVAADAFMQAESPEYRNQSLSLVGDSVSPAEAAKVFQSETGLELPRSYDFVGRLIRWGLREQLGVMFDWFETDGFGADLEANRERFPFMMDFRTWVREESAWKKT